MKKNPNIKRARPRLRSVITCYSLLLLVTLSACKKFVQIPSPDSQLVTASVFNNNASANSAVTYIYTQMFSNSESPNIGIQNGEVADELTSYANVANSSNYVYYRNNMNTGVNGSLFGEWVNAYKYIFQANAAITALQQYGGSSPAVKQQLTGEAYFIRAFWHFYLTNTYGDVPVALTTDYTITDQLARTPRAQVLQQVISDLKIAQGLLNTSYVDASDTTTTTDRVRPNKAVAAALLARTYLYIGDYDQSNNASDYQLAEQYASSVITNSNYSLCTNLSGANSVFLKNSAEAIWQLYTPLPASFNTLDGTDFILISAPSSVGGAKGVTVSPQLMNAFEPGDQRKTSWLSSITTGGKSYYFPYKYKVQTGGTTISEYTMVLRLAEQYLIRAEAETELGQTLNAVNDLNVIRNRAGLANYVGGLDKSSLLNAILHERQVELFTEWGHRWFDLNRALKNNSNGINVNTILGSPGNVCQAKGGTWNANDYQTLYPIPISEISKDIHLTQNPGY